MALFSPYKTIRSTLHNKNEATKRSRDRKENGKCTNATNRRSHVGLSTPFYTDKIVDYGCNCLGCSRTSQWHACVPLSPSRALSNCARKWKNFTGSPFGFLFHDSGIGNRFHKYQKHMFLSEHCFKYQTRVVHSELALRLTRMSDLSRFVYVGSHV